MGARGLVAAALLAAGAAVAGCAHDEPKPAVTPAPAPETHAVVAPTLAAPTSSTGTIVLSERLRAACGETKIESVADAPKFDFDQSQLLPEDRATLEQVARCLTSGPLKGKTLKLTGRADPRGTVSYNMALGERRANSVEKYLGALGVGEKQIRETSRGSLDAKGDNESEWAKDRRVDLDVLEP